MHTVIVVGPGVDAKSWSFEVLASAIQPDALAHHLHRFTDGYLRACCFPPEGPAIVPPQPLRKAVSA